MQDDRDIIYLQIESERGKDERDAGQANSYLEELLAIREVIDRLILAATP